MASTKLAYEEEETT
nr:hypothetical protein [Tanacetum cinerariifolium]